MILVSSEIWLLSKSAFQEKRMDIHTKLMRRYKQVPEWWFICILIANIGTTIFACEYYNEELQLPWWGVLFACSIAFFFTLPIGIIKATTNQVCGFNTLCILCHTDLTSSAFFIIYRLQAWMSSRSTLLRICTLDDPLQICASRYMVTSAWNKLWHFLKILSWVTTWRFHRGQCLWLR